LDLQLLVGLGNPGSRYAETRHNVGFMLLERLAAVESAPFRNQPRLQGLLAEIGSGPQRLRLLMPQTYMNESGRSIRSALDWFRLEPSQLLVLVDDMDLPFGRLRLRASGSAGGHNGPAVFEAFVGASLTAKHAVQVRADLAFASQDFAVRVNDRVAGLARFENSFTLGRIACGESGGCSGGQDRKNGQC
jgi:PTH1 family peptidyl-tRNA hydrolase